MNIEELRNHVQVDDHHIILGSPLVYHKYGKKIEVKQVNYWYEWPSFVYYLGNFLKYYYAVCFNSKLPDNLNDLKEFETNIRTTISEKQAFKYLVRVCSFPLIQLKLFGKWRTFYFGIKYFKIRWMMKYFTLDDWAELFCYVYLYNIEGQKKNLKNALKMITKAL